MRERKHRVAKKFAENTRRVGESFESSIVIEVLYMNVQDPSDKKITNCTLVWSNQSLPMQNCPGLCRVPWDFMAWSCARVGLITSWVLSVLSTTL